MFFPFWSQYLGNNASKPIVEFYSAGLGGEPPPRSRRSGAGRRAAGLMADSLLGDRGSGGLFAEGGDDLLNHRQIPLLNGISELQICQSLGDREDLHGE